MDDALLVRGLERLGDLACDWHRLVEREQAARNPLGERLPLHKLQNERVRLA